MKKISEFAAITIFILLTCFALKTKAQSITQILLVADRKAGCRGTIAKDCLQIKHLSEEKYSLLRRNIEGFTYTPGYFYVLEIQAVNNSKQPFEAAGIKYRLKRILAREKSEIKSKMPNNQGLFETDWKLTKIDGAATKSEKVFIKFDEQKKYAGGNGGCNSFGGTLAVDGSQIKISQVISTQMYCQETSPTEKIFFDKLQNVTKYELLDGKLRFQAENRVILEFEPK